MLRPELIAAGCVLALIGILLFVVGYHKTQPTTADRVVGFLEELSGESAPNDLKTNMTPGYLAYAGGATFVLAGLVLIVKSHGKDDRSKTDK